MNNSRTSKMIRSDLVAHLGLSFTDESWDDLLGLIAEKVRTDRGNTRINNKALFRECEQLQAACDLLRKFHEGRTESGWNWASCLTPFMAQVDDKNANDGANEGGSCLRGSDLSPKKDPSDQDNEKALNPFLDMLDQISGVAKFIVEWRIPPGAEHAGWFRDLHKRVFAESLAYHFKRAGGMFRAGGPAGFPEFLKLIWHLLPPDCRTPTADSFADILSRLVCKAEVQKMQRMPFVEPTSYLFED